MVWKDGWCGRWVVKKDGWYERMGGVGGWIVLMVFLWLL